MGVESDDEFRDFMRGRWSAMVRLAYTLTGDQGHAEDIAQAAFASAYAAWGRARRAGDPDAYVRAIVIHENSKRFRKQRVREDLRAAVPANGASNRCTGCATPHTAKTPIPDIPETARRSWPPAGTSPSACSTWPASPRSPAHCRPSDATGPACSATCRYETI